MAYYVASIPYSGELYHHGILGQKWGKQNGPPYPLDAKDHSKAEQKAGWRKSLEKEQGSDFHRESSKKIQKNKDGSYKIPKGFIFNRVGQETLDVNKSGALYVSSGKNDAARYVRNLGPTLIGKLMGEYGTTVQHISVDKDIKLASDDQSKRFALEYLLKNDKARESFNNSYYAMAYDQEITSENIKKILSTNDIVSQTRLAWTFFSMFGNKDYSQETMDFYKFMKDKGFDAIPDLNDKLTGISENPLIVINPDKLKISSTTRITKEIMREGKQWVKQIGKLKIDESIRSL